LTMQNFADDFCDSRVAAPAQPQMLRYSAVVMATEQHRHTDIRFEEATMIMWLDQQNMRARCIDAVHYGAAVPVQRTGGGLCSEEACHWGCSLRAGPAGAVFWQDAAAAQAAAQAQGRRPQGAYPADKLSFQNSRTATSCMWKTLEIVSWKVTRLSSSESGFPLLDQIPGAKCPYLAATIACSCRSCRTAKPCYRSQSKSQASRTVWSLQETKYLPQPMQSWNFRPVHMYSASQVKPKCKCCTSHH